MVTFCVTTVAVSTIGTIFATSATAATAVVIAVLAAATAVFDVVTALTAFTVVTVAVSDAATACATSMVAVERAVLTACCAGLTITCSDALGILSACALFDGKINSNPVVNKAAIINLIFLVKARPPCRMRLHKYYTRMII